jgi:hypothetical protein
MAEAPTIVFQKLIIYTETDLSDRLEHLAYNKEANIQKDATDLGDNESKKCCGPACCKDTSVKSTTVEERGCCNKKCCKGQQTEAQ